MTFIEKLQMIERIDQLIRMKATGNAKDLAERLGVSRRSVFDILACMDSMGAEIIFNKHSLSYEYKRPVVFYFGFLPQEKHRNIKGGKRKIYNFLQECKFSALAPFTFASR